MTDLLMTLAEISLTMSAVILLLLALGPLLARRYAARWRYWAWLVVAVFAIEMILKKRGGQP